MTTQPGGPKGNAMDVLSAVNLRRTPQSEQADPRQVVNNAGGYTFTLDDEARLRRFLILGTDGPTYYTSAADLTRDNAAVVLRMAAEQPKRLVDVVVEISAAGRAPRQNPALFSLAAAAGVADAEGRAYALAKLADVARTGTHLFLFARYVEQFRGWGRQLRRAIGDWYQTKDVDRVAYQAVKYRQREGWSHRDLLRLAHPVTSDMARAGLYDWIAGRAGHDLPAIVSGYLAAQDATTAAEWVRIIRDTPGISWEMLPDAALTERTVWDALLDAGLPQTALMRQLPRLTRLGVARDRRDLIATQLTDRDRIRKALVHPINVLVAQRTYASGRSARGDGIWTPVPQITDALDAAFYASFGNVEPAGKRTLIALDVSGSMTSPISNLPLSAREASAAMAMVTMATESDVDVVGFTGGGFYYGYQRRVSASPDEVISTLNISPRQRLDDVIRAVSGLPFGATDCALPMLWAQEQRRSYDTFIIFTDNETWQGEVHAHQALKRYREHADIPAKLIVSGMTSTGFTIADPADPGMLDVVGFDSAAPALIADFSRGW